MRPFVPTLALLAAMAACAPRPEPPVATATASFGGGGGAQPADLGSAPWRLVELTGTTIPAGTPEPRYPTLVFAAASGSVSGMAGVNRFTGGFTRTGPDGLTLAPGAMTRMAGPPEAMALEDAVVAMFAAVRRFRLDGDRLVLLDERGVSLSVWQR